MANVQQPEMRRSGETRLVQDSDGPDTHQSGSPSKEHRSVSPDQVSPYGPSAGREASSQEPTGRAAEVLEADPAAMQLRVLSTMTEVASERLRTDLPAAGGMLRLSTPSATAPTAAKAPTPPSTPIRLTHPSERQPVPVQDRPEQGRQRQPRAEHGAEHMHPGMPGRIHGGHT